MNLLGNPDFLRGLFSIFLVVIIVSIFELTFYLIVVVPQINKQLIKLTEALNFKFDIVAGFARGLAITNQEDADYTNSLKIGIMCTIIGVVILFLTATYFRLRRKTKGYPHGTDLKPVFISSAIIIILLLCFQIFMYIFGTKYNYASQRELNIRFINALLKEQGSPVIDLPSGTSLVKT